MHLNLLIKYAANILRSFCDYSANILIKVKIAVANMYGTIIANSLRTSRDYAANMISENLVSAVGNIWRMFCPLSVNSIIKEKIMRQ